MLMLPRKMPEKAYAELVGWFQQRQVLQHFLVKRCLPVLPKDPDVALLVGDLTEPCKTFAPYLPVATLQDTIRGVVAKWVTTRRGRWDDLRKTCAMRVPKDALISLLERNDCVDDKLAVARAIEGDSVVLSRSGKVRRSGRHELYVRLPRTGCAGTCPPPVPPTAVIGIDEGVRTMLTMYSTGGEIIEWGSKADLHVMESAALQAAGIQSAYTQAGVSHKRRHRCKKARLRLFEKNRNRRKDLHGKVNKYLCENAAVVISGQLSPTIALTDRTRKLGKTVVKQWLSWSHFEWRKRLADKQELYDHLVYIMDEEPWTTRTCCRCGTVRQLHSVARHYFFETMLHSDGSNRTSEGRLPPNRRRMPLT